MKTVVTKALILMSLCTSISSFAGNDQNAVDPSEGSNRGAAEAACTEKYRRKLTVAGAAQSQGYSDFMNSCVNKELLAHGQTVVDSMNRIYVYEAKEASDLTKAEDKCRNAGRGADLFVCLEEQGIKIKATELPQVSSSDQSSNKCNVDKKGAKSILGFIKICKSSEKLKDLSLADCLALFDIKYKGGVELGQINHKDEKKDEEQKYLNVRPTAEEESEEAIAGS